MVFVFLALIVALGVLCVVLGLRPREDGSRSLPLIVTGAILLVATLLLAILPSVTARY